MIVIGTIAIINNKALLTKESSHQNTPVNTSILIYFIPLYNYYIWYNEPLDEHNYRWVKESVLRWSLYIIIISIRSSSFIIFLGLFLIIARCIMVTTGIDIINSKAKNFLNNAFIRNIEELIAYPLGIIIHALKKLFQKTSVLQEEITSRKQTYSVTDKISNWRTIISYIIIAGAL
jgi:hypothetical protein